MISPPILLLALPARTAAARRARPCAGPRPGRAANEVGLVGLAWFLGTYLPFVAASLIESRTSYLYYMVIVMPGSDWLVADLIARIGPRRKLVLVGWPAWWPAAVVLYPFTPL